MAEVGIFVVPDAGDPALAVEQALVADGVGLDYVAVQDHPYQRRYFDTWTYLSYIAGRTAGVRLVPDVINLPLRPPAMLAKAAASLDVLSGGRVEIGLGAGSFWEAIEAMGGPRRTPRESVDALIEAIEIMRGFWSGERALRHEGEHYRLAGAKPGPAPEHPIGIWIGAYGPRMLRVTGRLGDGWLPTLGGNYLSAEDVPPMQRAIDEAARSAGRDPAAVKRVANLIGLEGEPSGWLDQLRRAAELGFEALLVGVTGEDAERFIRRLGEEVVPAFREQAA
ncbi:MAG: LLM class flavin-dependent oxidoreductase [Solirubrobacterales bacterium]|nr:LLM class flavin-dependent oxidoreductase [Solirubrobacterales bacterium]